MKLEELINDLDPVTLIEFKNYIQEHLSDLCSTKNSNSKIISKFRSKELFYERCRCKLYRNEKQKMESKNISVVVVRNLFQKQLVQLFVIVNCLLKYGVI